MGVSEMGDYVEYNKLLSTSDLFIYCGTVQSSNWGGMTGCGVIIGLAGARSMRSTHSWDVVGDPSPATETRTKCSTGITRTP